eukprot:scaffold71484_cov72-Phaeocystis_antarctica.AAC.2
MGSRRLMSRLGTRRTKARQSKMRPSGSMSCSAPMMTGTAPEYTASTGLGVHSANPRGHSMKRERA